MKRTPLKKISKKRQAMRKTATPDRNAWIDDQGDFCWHCGSTPAGYGMGNTARIDTHEMVFYVSTQTHGSDLITQECAARVTIDATVERLR